MCLYTLYRHWGSVQSVQALRLCTDCTGTEALYRLYRHWGSVQTVQALRLCTVCTGTEALYRHWGSVQALRLCTGRTARRGSGGIALAFHDHGTRRGWGVSVTLRALITPGKDSVPIVQEAGWAPGPVWTGAENLAHTGIRSPDRPARIQSLCRLH